MSRNELSSLEPLKNCILLRELYLRSNKLKRVADLSCLCKLQNLRILTLEGNLLARDGGYISDIARLLPQLKQIDGCTDLQSFRSSLVEPTRAVDGGYDSLEGDASETII